MKSYNLIPLSAKYKRHHSRKLGHRIIGAWRNKWLEDDSDIEQSDLNIYKNYEEEKDRDAFRKISEKTDYELKGHDTEENKKGGVKKHGEKFPAYLM